MDILKLEILSHDLKETERFYHDILGFNVIHTSHHEISFQAGTTALTFKYVETIRPVYHFAFNIPNNKLDEAFKWTQDRVEIMDVTPGNKIADFVNWNARSIYFYDNNGNILEFIARYELDNKSDADFSAASILNISEIGVATDDVATQCDKLITQFDLPVFSKQPRLPNFTAMGDHNGLLILSIQNRHWYPTEKLAQKHYTSLQVCNNGQQHSLAFHTPA
jgi:catechol-2,3-dioxygenase